jgi:hypothetical protein
MAKLESHKNFPLANSCQKEYYFTISSSLLLCSIYQYNDTENHNGFNATLVRENKNAPRSPLIPIHLNDDHEFTKQMANDGTSHIYTFLPLKFSFPRGQLISLKWHNEQRNSELEPHSEHMEDTFHLPRGNCNESELSQQFKSVWS